MDFLKVNDVSTLLPILEKRLPYSANVYNLAKLYPKWIEEMKWYTLGETRDMSIILVVIFRLDRKQEILISRHIDAPITEEIREAFIQTMAINWKETYRFGSLDQELCNLVGSISTEYFGNYTDINPCVLYVMDVEKAKLLNTEYNFGDGVEISPISGDPGTDFITSTWKYTVAGTRDHVMKVMNRNLSSGASVNGEIVSGANMSTTGYIGMLYTLKEYRGKGYGSAVMRLIMKNCANNGFIPSCLVESWNLVSQEFQIKLGFTKAPWRRYDILHTKPVL